MKRWFPVLVLLTCASQSAAEDLLRFDFSKVAASFPIEDRSKVAVAGAGLTVAIERPFARPQDRYVEALLQIAPDGVPLHDVRVRAQLFNVADGKAVSTLTVAPTAERARVLADMRAARQPAMGLRVELLQSSKVLAVAQALLRAQECDRPLQPAEKVRIGLDGPEGAGALSQWPVTFGVPFPAGALWDIGRLRLVDGKGRELPAQTEAVAHWAREGAIQWVRFDALVSPPDGCFVAMAESARPSPEPAEKVRVVERGDSVTIHVAEAEYALGKGSSPIRQVSMDGRLVATAAGARGLYVISHDGKLAAASAEGETLLTESRGPIAACVRFEGPYRTADGGEQARHITRVEFFAGRPAAFITHTLILTNDTNKVWFTDVGWELSVHPGDGAKALFGVSRTDWAKSFQHPLQTGRAAFMLQDDYTQFSGGRKRFIVAEDSPSRTLLEGDECGDWAAVQGKSAGLMVSCRDAARQHPKEFEASAAKLNLKLFSGRAGEHLDFRPPALAKRWNKGGKIPPALQEQILKQPSNAVGWAKTHQFLFRPVPSSATADEMARLSRLHSTPVLALADPEWIHRS
ncbi:MAG: hypothetical protein FJ279_12420 [Planctomycetes bacterium]|nr:hypothetical protein [Planctomycetota bacterium]